jgi:hypothetical protein
MRRDDIELILGTQATAAPRDGPDYVLTLAGGREVRGDRLLTHVGRYQGEVVASNILGEPREAHYEAGPDVVYTDPQAASVGTTQARFTATVPVSEVAKMATYTTGRDPERLEHAAELGALSTSAFDGTDPAALQRFFTGLPGQIDRVMVTAGSQYYAPQSRPSPPTWP